MGGVKKGWSPQGRPWRRRGVQGKKSDGSEVKGLRKLFARSVRLGVMLHTGTEVRIIIRLDGGLWKGNGMIDGDGVRVVCGGRVGLETRGAGGGVVPRVGERR